MSFSTASSVPKRTRKPLYPRGWGSGNVAYVGTFRAFSLAVLGRSSLEIGDKIILPPQALQSINRLRLPFPLIFEVRKYSKSSSNMLSQNEVINQYKRRIENIYRSTNPAKINKIDKWLKKYRANPHDLYSKICATYNIVPKPKISCARNHNNNSRSEQKRNKKYQQKQKSFGKQYCSVYEFSSPQADSAYLPHWMMQNLGIDEGHKIELQSKFKISKGTFCKLQPYKQEFMDKVGSIGYKSTLEHSLRHYSVLAVNQRIVVEFNHFPYQCIVKETKPHDVISILGSTDLEIEFEEALELTHGLEPNIIESEDNNNINNDNNNNDDENLSCDDTSSSSCLITDETCTKSEPVTSEEIDGVLLKKLGVPLDYNEQTNLATMIIENRKLMQENESRFDDNDDENENEEKSVSFCENNSNDDRSPEPQVSEAGPDDIECKNCGKYVHSMSFQMHEMHCFRQFVRCKKCDECIHKNGREEHNKDFHEEFTCLCSEIIVGHILYTKHQETQCRLRVVECSKCKASNIPFMEIKEHEAQCKDAGVMCILCGKHVEDSKDKLLHLLTSCKERRAICNYCGTFRMCHDMEEHRAFCGSRSEKCSKCNQFVSLMNMEPHLQSNCQWFNNNQLSSKGGNIKSKLESLDLNNPYIDQQLLNNEELNDDDSLFGLLKTNPTPTLLDDSFAIDAVASSTNKQLCPHCENGDLLMSEEEFQIHIATKHAKLVNNTLTQTVMASFHDAEILKSSSNNKKKKIKKRRKLSKTNEKWSCSVCTFMNAKSKLKCIMCKAPKSS